MPTGAKTYRVRPGLYETKDGMHRIQQHATWWVASSWLADPDDTTRGEWRNVGRFTSKATALAHVLRTTGAGGAGA